MNFGKDKCNIFWQATITLVLCSDTVKEPAAVPVVLGCENKPFYYRSTVTCLAKDWKISFIKIWFAMKCHKTLWKMVIWIALATNYLSMTLWLCND